jgi:tetratricopeptide (TPR) repeat protein/serine/threonine protein kinase
MASDSAIEVLQGELERLFELGELKKLSSDVLGFDPERVGGTASKGAFARSLVGHCVDQDAVDALVDAILFSSEHADGNLRSVLKSVHNGELRPGTLVGGLRVVKKIGEGDLSVVYLAEGNGAAGEVQRAALKVIRPQFARDRAAVHRFTTVSRFLQSLSSPGLAPIFGVGTLDDARPWVAAAYLGGQTLAQRIERSGSLHINEARPIFAGILEGLAALHVRGLIHGDVRAENVFVVREDGASEAGGVLVDAGADRLFGVRAPLTAKTGLSPVLGIAKTVAPEQARGLELDHRTDIYQVGALMYETLAGRPPFVGKSPIDVVAQHVLTTPEPPSTYARKGWVSPALDAVVLRALAKDPEERWQSAEALIEEIDRAARKPSVHRPLDEAAFQEVRRSLLLHPSDEAVADRLEDLARQSDALARAADTLLEVVSATRHRDSRLSLLHRAARIYATDLKDPLRAESAYQQVLAMEPENEVALSGIEAAKRAAGDYEGLIGALLDKIERTPGAQARTRVLLEVATLYEKRLRDPENALVAFTQALTTDPYDTEAAKNVERLAGSDEARWGEVLGALSQSAQDLEALRNSDENAQLTAAQAAVEEQKALLAHIHEVLAQRLADRNSDLEALLAQASERLQAAEEAFAQATEQADKLEAELEGAARHVEELARSVEAQQSAAEQTRAAAESRVDAFEQLQAEAGDAPTPEQQQQLEAIASEAEALVAQAEQEEQAAEQAAAELEASRAALAESQHTLEAAQSYAAEAESALNAERLAADEQQGGAEPTPDEQAEVAEAEQALRAATAALAALEQRDAGEASQQRKRDLANLTETYVRMGRWAGERLGQVDYAMQCFSQALAIDPAQDDAYQAVLDVYRASQSWPELASTLLARADNAQSPVKARDYRAEAAVVIAGKLNDIAGARVQLERVLAGDPDHPAAQRALADILREQQEWPELAELLERSASAHKGEARVQALLSLAEVYEDRLGDTAKAAAKYQAVLEIEPRDPDALKGLERIHGQNENYEGLIESLRAQVELAATPKQRIALLERIGHLLEEEFVDHSQAAERFEEIIAVDGGHEAANAALARLYRHLQRFEDLVETLDRHAGSIADEARKIELLLQAARVLAVEVGSPERAIETYEQVLAIDPQHEGALSELARLRATAGDVGAAVEAVERLAEQEQDPQKQAQYWIRAAKLLVDGGDRDSAILRYKRALELDAHAAAAAEGLRAIYAQRGDARGESEMLQHAIQIADGDVKRAALLAELGALYRDQLETPEQARASFEEALQLDSTNTLAAAGLARIAFSEGRHEHAAAYYEQISGRLAELPASQAGELSVEAAQAYQELGETEPALAALKRARELLPDDMELAERHARFVLDSGDAPAAERVYERILKDFDDRIDTADRVRLLLALAEAQLGGKYGERAQKTLQRVLEIRPEDPGALAAMTRAYELMGTWNEVISLLQLRSRRAADEDEMFELLVKTGDVFLESLRDRDAAAQTYVMALDVKPDSRNLLTKLMSVYSDAQDWPRLIEVILRIAEMVKDSPQLAKYYNTAATIAHHELSRFDEAANYYEESLSHVPPEEGDAQFEGLVACLTENQNWERLERAYETRVSRLREVGADGTRVAALLDACGEIVQDRLGRLNDALQLFEEALELEPDNENRRSLLTAVYSKEPKRFFQRAVASHRYYLAQDPYRVDSLQALRRIYTSGKKPDESWCVCQALRCLQMADADEEKFFKKYRLTRLPKMKQAVTDDLWREFVVHPAQDPTLTAIFAALQPAVVASQSRPLASFGVHEQYRVDPLSDPTAMGRMLGHVSESTAVHLPPAYHCPQDPGGLSFLFAAPPAIGIGEGAKAGGPQQALAFVAGRHLSYYRPGNYLRQLVPTGTGLRAWLIGAIRLVAPRFPAPGNMEDHVRECVDAIGRQLVGPQRDAVRSMTQKLLDAAPELDMRAWMAGVDLTADRIGFVLSNDLKIANAVIEASPEDSSSVSRKERLSELLAYSVSEQYFELRKHIGIALGG